MLFYGVYKVGGYVGLQLAFSLLVSAIVGLTYLLCSLWSRNWKSPAGRHWIAAVPQR